MRSALNLASQARLYRMEIHLPNLFSLFKQGFPFILIADKQMKTSAPLDNSVAKILTIAERQFFWTKVQSHGITPLEVERILRIIKTKKRFNMSRCESCNKGNGARNSCRNQFTCKYVHVHTHEKVPTNPIEPFVDMNIEQKLTAVTPVGAAQSSKWKPVMLAPNPKSAPFTKKQDAGKTPKT